MKKPSSQHNTTNVKNMYLKVDFSNNNFNIVINLHLNVLLHNNLKQIISCILQVPLRR